MARAYAELVERLVQHPLMYPLRSDKRLSERGCRRVVLSGTSYLVFCPVSGETVTIAHLFHQRSDCARLV
uniref:type II toxin-antitoxin system RelE/ParE family toxin n=1 Tax=Parolsenella massiliensis TaxID=1871022 RepID=UPI0012FF1C9D